MNDTHKAEFGDFQTPLDLAREISEFLRVTGKTADVMWNRLAVKVVSSTSPSPPSLMQRRSTVLTSIPIYSDAEQAPGCM